MPVKLYWKNIFCYLLLAVLSWLLTDVILYSLPLSEPSQGYGMWIVYALVASLFFVDIGGEFLLLFRRNAFVSEAFSA